MISHERIVTRCNIVADSDGAQSNVALSAAVATGQRIVLTRLSVSLDNGSTGNLAVTIGFGASSVPSPTLAGVAGVVFHAAMGGGQHHTVGDGSSIIAVGGDGEELRITCADPAAGNWRISYSYYLVY
jgi:hypothetical protein